MWLRLCKERTKAKETHTSVIVALWLPAAKAKALAKMAKGLKDAESADAYHITLCYLGKKDDLKDKESVIKQLLTDFGREFSPIEGKVSGFGRFNGEGEKDAIYASFDAPHLNTVRERLIEQLEEYGIEISRLHGFTPHITMLYCGSNEETPPLDIQNLEITFPSITLCWGDDQTTYPLKG